MRCPKCEYVAEPGEAKVEGQCPNCEVFYHKVLKPPQEERAESLAKPSGIQRYLLLAAVVVIVLAGACFYGFKTYAHHQLSESVQSILRQTNGQLAELLDENAKRSNAEFLRIYQGRMDDLDKLVAQALAIDDGPAPGVSAATADYVRASRAFLKCFSDELQSRVALSVDEAMFESASKFLETDEGKRFAELSDDEVGELYSFNLDMISQAKDFDSKLFQLKRGAELESLGRKRISYLKAKEKLAASKSRHESALQVLGRSGDYIGKAGVALETLLGEKLPIQAWGLKH